MGSQKIMTRGHSARLFNRSHSIAFDKLELGNSRTQLLHSLAWIVRYNKTEIHGEKGKETGRKGGRRARRIRTSNIVST